MNYASSPSPASSVNASFSSNNDAYPTHWRNKETGSIMWRSVDGVWNRISKEGRVSDNSSISCTPYNYPDDYEPLYGDLQITLSFGS